MECSPPRGGFLIRAPSVPTGQERLSRRNGTSCGRGPRAKVCHLRRERRGRAGNRSVTLERGPIGSLQAALIEWLHTRRQLVRALSRVYAWETRAPADALSVPMERHISVIARYACRREIDGSGTTPDFQIDVNRARVPDAPALIRPCREVIAHGDCPARAGGAPDAPHLGPRRDATVARIRTGGSGRRVLDQVVRTPIDRGRDAARLCRHSLE